MTARILTLEQYQAHQAKYGRHGNVAFDVPVRQPDQRPAPPQRPAHDGACPSPFMVTEAARGTQYTPRASSTRGPVALAAGPAERRAKYGNERVDGFDSKKERDRAFTLELMEAAGQIRNIRRRVTYLLIPAQHDEQGRCIERAATYTPDFVYEAWPHWHLVAEDVKSEPTKTQAYVLRRKLMLFVHHIRIKEV